MGMLYRGPYLGSKLRPLETRLNVVIEGLILQPHLLHAQAAVDREGTLDRGTLQHHTPKGVEVVAAHSCVRGMFFEHLRHSVVFHMPLLVCLQDPLAVFPIPRQLHADA